MEALPESIGLGLALASFCLDSEPGGLGLDPFGNRSAQYIPESASAVDMIQDFSLIHIELEGGFLKTQYRLLLSSDFDKVPVLVLLRRALCQSCGVKYDHTRFLCFKFVSIKDPCGPEIYVTELL